MTRQRLDRFEVLHRDAGRNLDAAAFSTRGEQIEAAANECEAKYTRDDLKALLTNLFVPFDAANATRRQLALLYASATVPPVFVQSTWQAFTWSPQKPPYACTTPPAVTSGDKKWGGGVSDQGKKALQAAEKCPELGETDALSVAEVLALRSFIRMLPLSKEAHEMYRRVLAEQPEWLAGADIVLDADITKCCLLHQIAIETNRSVYRLGCLRSCHC